MRGVTNRSSIEDLIRRGAHFYVGHSGGKDSQAQYAALREIIPTDHLHVVHADLGDVEWAGVKDHIRANISHPLMLAQAIFKDGSSKDMFSRIRARRASLDAQGKHDAPAWPSSTVRFCTSDLKTGPIWKVIRNDGHKLVVNCVGIRGAESPARAKRTETRGTLNLNKSNTNSVREAYDWWPIAHWNCRTDRGFDATMTDDVFDAIAEVDQVPHPAYASGNERLSCVFCIFGSVSDLRHGAAARPELYQRYIDLEIEVRSTMFNGKSLADRVAVQS